jgi:hypothetical protein
MKQKKIYLNTDKTLYCIAKLFKKKKNMQEAYKKFSPNDKNHFKVLGAHRAYEKWLVSKKPKIRVSKKGVVKAFMSTKLKGIETETGTLFLSLEDCGASVISHEIMHAVLWANKFKKYKKQYPITIKSMEEEERILYNFSFAIRQFYNWYWEIKSKV